MPRSHFETQLKSLVTRRNNIDGDIARLVDHLRFMDYSWTQIGNILGVTRQAAQQRYGD